METLKCRRCKGEHQAVEMTKGGWCPACVTDQRERSKKHYQAHHEEIRARHTAAYRTKRGGMVRPYRTVWPEGTKGCSRCSTVKPLADFREDREKRLGVVAFCRDCERAYHRERVKNRTPEQRAIHNAQMRKYSVSPRGSRTQYAKQIKRLYGLTIEEYEERLDQQGHVCAICHKPEVRVLRGKVARLCVDHDHDTMAVRELICHRCNRTVELLESSPGLADQMLDYLKRHRLTLVATTGP